MYTKGIRYLSNLSANSHLFSFFKTIPDKMSYLTPTKNENKTDSSLLHYGQAKTPFAHQQTIISYIKRKTPDRLQTRGWFLINHWNLPFLQLEHTHSRLVLITGSCDWLGSWCTASLHRINTHVLECKHGGKGVMDKQGGDVNIVSVEKVYNGMKSK